MPPAGNWLRFSCSIPPLFVLSHSLLMVNTMGKLALFWRFSLTASSLPSDSLATILPPLATRHYLLRPSPAGYCMQPTAELGKTERDPISTSTPSISVCHRNRRFLQTKSIRFSPLAAAQPLTILSWPEALNASGSRRACRMAISRNASSLLALPDVPEFAPAVRYGVPGTRNAKKSSSLVKSSLRPTPRLSTWKTIPPWRMSPRS